MHSADIEQVTDLVDDALAKLERRIEPRAVLEEALMRAWQRGAKRYPPRLPQGVSSYPPNAITPVFSPRPAIEAPHKKRRGM